jgi:hypothetical protein
VSPSDGVSQDTRANTSILMAWLNLDFADFNSVRLIKQLNHADSRTIHVYD